MDLIPADYITHFEQLSAAEDADFAQICAGDLAGKEVQELQQPKSPACLVYTLAAMDLHTEASPADLVVIRDNLLFHSQANLVHSVLWTASGAGSTASVTRAHHPSGAAAAGPA